MNESINKWLWLLISSFVFLGLTGCAVNNTSRVNIAADNKNKLDIACGKLPVNADLTQSTQSIVNWCRQGLYKTTQGTLALLNQASVSTQIKWSSSSMPDVDLTPNRQAPKSNIIILKAPVNR